MRYIFAFCGLVALTIACGSETPAGDADSRKANTETAAVDGKKVYKQYCVTCHGLYGDMGASGAHDLTGSQLSVNERIQVILKGRGAMTPFESILDAEKVKAVAEYTLELKK